jgi:dihydrofolate reductase
MTIGVIFAKSSNNVIGKDNTLPWHIPEDLKHFKEITQFQSILMGRKTWESLPLRPLPKRINIVLTSNPDLIESLDGERDYNVTVESDLIKVMDYYKNLNRLHNNNSPLWVIGGANLINETLKHHATVAWVTEIHKEYEGDTYVDDLDFTWKEELRLPNESSTGIKFDLVKYVKI